MPLKNYTTTVPIARTLTQVQAKLVEYGACGVLYNYGDDGRIVSLAFQVQLKSGMLLAFRLPANVKATQKVMEKQGLPQRYLELDHAYRVAWRIIKDWVESQMALIETGQVDLEQVFLPYMILPKTDKTLYEMLLDRGFKLPQLEAGD